MKKLFLAVLIPAVHGGAALAQTSVNVYGLVDAGFVHESGAAAGSLNKLSSGVGGISRLGFKGSEDLGAGLSALFVLETGYKVDTGESDVAGAIFNRQAFVGLKSTYGTLTLGRQYTPYYSTIVSTADPFAAGYAGTSKNLFPTVGNSTRTSNTIMLASPNYSGVTAQLAYAFGEQAGDNSAGRQIGAAIGYGQGPLDIRLAYLNRNNETVAVPATATTPAVVAGRQSSGRNTLLAANYNFQVAKLFLAYSADRGPNSAVLPNASNPFGGVRPTASTDSDDVLVGVSVPFGQTTVLASYIHKNDRTGLNQDANQLAIGAVYAVSKRTSFYTAFARIDNKNGAGYTVGNNGEAGSGDRAFNLGVRHSF